jgi:hypothetical protein
MVTNDVRPCLYDVIIKLEDNLGCKRKIWFDKALCGDFTIVWDESADTAESAGTYIYGFPT